MEQQDMKDIMLILGNIEGKMNIIAQQNHRTTLALIGLIAAMVGVKVLGTPILLDIATILALLGVILTIGLVILATWHRKERSRLTKTGWLLLHFYVWLIITQVAVYFRDLGCCSADFVYAVRIGQNFSILLFLWQSYTERYIYRVYKD